ncbi:unnamed protein product [Prunus armeniaca]
MNNCTSLCTLAFWDPSFRAPSPIPLPFSFTKFNNLGLVLKGWGPYGWHMLVHDCQQRGALADDQVFSSRPYTCQSTIEHLRSLLFTSIGVCVEATCVWGSLRKRE